MNLFTCEANVVHHVEYDSVRPDDILSTCLLTESQDMFETSDEGAVTRNDA